MERQNTTTLQFRLEVPDRLAREAGAAGLLTARALSRMLAAAVRRAAIGRLLAGARRASRSAHRPLSMRKIQAEVTAVRKKRTAIRRSR